MIIALLLSGAVLARLFQIQIVMHSHYSAIAEDQHKDRVPIKLPRGRIFDRRGEVLALDIPRSYSYGVHPKRIKNKKALAKKLSNAMGHSPAYYMDKLTSGQRYVWLFRQLDADGAAKVRKIEGLIEQYEVKRCYPFGRQTPKAIGFTNRDCIGASGLEMLYENSLASTAGWEFVLEDALGNQAKNAVDPMEPPVPGHDVVTSIDYIIQNFAAQELRATVQKYDAKGGFVIVMLPRTGEILAICSEPSMDPNSASGYSTKTQREISVVDMYEPGSTFKAATLLSAIKCGIPLGRQIDCSKSIKVGSHSINDVHANKILTVEEVIIQSSNIGTGRLAMMAGADSLYKTARDMGFGAPTGVEIPGEARGNLPGPKVWDQYLRATLGIGQGLSCTGLQLASAYASIAADGILMKPRIVRAVIGEDNEVVFNPPKSVRRVASREQMETVTDVLVRVVEEGTGKSAKIDGVKIAGKTGTAQKYDPALKKYSDEKHWASFIGYTVEEPRILCLVAIDEPLSEHYGGSVAAPCFKSIMERAIPIVTAEQRSQMGPQMHGDYPLDECLELPEMMNLPKDDAKAILNGAGIIVFISGEGTRITGQYPLPGSFIAEGDTVYLNAEESDGGSPIVQGLPSREAAKQLIAAGFDVQIAGNGVVQRAEFIEGKCYLYCNPVVSVN